MSTVAKLNDRPAIQQDRFSIGNQVRDDSTNPLLFGQRRSAPLVKGSNRIPRISRPPAGSANLTDSVKILQIPSNRGFTGP